MNSTDYTKIFLSMFLMSLPTLIVCLVAGVVILTKWRQASSGSLWALLGFSLALFLCFAVPIGQTMLQPWVFQSGERANRMWALTAFAVVNTILHSVVYLFLLVAIFAGRSKPETANPPPPNRP